MQMELVVALALAIPLILFTVAYVLYSNIRRIGPVSGEAHIKTGVSRALQQLLKEHPGSGAGETGVGTAPAPVLSGIAEVGAEAGKSTVKAPAGTTSQADALCREAALIALRQLLRERRPGYKAGEKAVPEPVAGAGEAGPEARKLGVTRVQVFPRRVAPEPEAEEAGEKAAEEPGVREP